MYDEEMGMLGWICVGGGWGVAITGSNMFLNPGDMMKNECSRQQRRVACLDLDLAFPTTISWRNVGLV